MGALLQSELGKNDETRKIPVIVRMHDPVAIKTLTVPTRRKGNLRSQARTKLIHTLKERAERSRRPLQAVLNRNGIYQVRKLWLINGFSFEATPAQINEIARLPEVASIIVDAVIEAPDPPQTQTVGLPEANISLVNAPSLWSLGYTGQGVTVAIMDTGVDINHADLETRWRNGTNSWFDPHGEHPDVPTDKVGHGTQVAGIVLGGDNGGTSIGVAPDAQWIGVKVFDDADASTISTFHLSFQWLLDPDNNPNTDDAPDIVNNSWGFKDGQGLCDESSLVFQPDIQVLKAAGIAVVFSAGNTGPSPYSSVAPANYPESFAVGSVGTLASATEISEFSARGPSACDNSIYPEIVAPGSFVRTSDLTSGGAFPASYAYVSGTSFAAPHVSGAMALLLGAFPDTPVTLLETALTLTAVDLGVVSEDNTYGYGMLDSLAAFYYLDSPANDEFHLLAPSRGEVWTRGTTYTVRWVLNPDADDYRLAYFDVDGMVHRIGSVGNVASFNWTIPLNALAESGKSLRVAAFNGGNLVATDRSDEPFTILPHMYPNGGELLAEGMSYNLTWAAIAGADNYRLVYFDADNTLHLIANAGQATDYIWTVPFAALAGDGKRFRVTAFSSSTRLSTIQRSEDVFTITSQMYPNGGERLTIGITYPLQWAAVPGADRYRLYYFDANNSPHWIANVRNATTFDWRVPLEALPETGKRFRVTSFNGTTKLSEIQWSDGEFSIEEPP